MTLNAFDIFELVCVILGFALLLCSLYQIWLESVVSFDELRVHFHRIVLIVSFSSCIVHSCLFTESRMGRNPILHNIQECFWDIRSLAGLYSLYFLVSLTITKTQQAIDLRLRIDSSDHTCSQVFFRVLYSCLVNGFRVSPE